VIEYRPRDNKIIADTSLESFPVPFEILECFKYFHQEIEFFLVGLTRRNIDENVFQTPIVIQDANIFRLCKQAFADESIQLLRLLIDLAWPTVQHLPSDY
jgi:hypothetical protein